MSNPKVNCQVFNSSLISFLRLSREKPSGDSSVLNSLLKISKALLKSLKTEDFTRILLKTNEIICRKGEGPVNLKVSSVLAISGIKITLPNFACDTFFAP
ncbi:hypothetical protein ES708_06289 [subsurface metagenome]